MELRTAASPKDVKYYDTKRLREEFLIEKVFYEDEILFLVLFTVLHCFL